MIPQFPVADLTIVAPPYRFQTDSNKKLESREKELSDSKLLIQQHEAHIKTVAESMKQLETKKQGLERQVDELNEECANLKAQGGRSLEIIFSIRLIERLNLVANSMPSLKTLLTFSSLDFLVYKFTFCYVLLFRTIVHVSDCREQQRKI